MTSFHCIIAPPLLNCPVDKFFKQKPWKANFFINQIPSVKYLYPTKHLHSTPEHAKSDRCTESAQANRARRFHSKLRPKLTSDLLTLEAAPWLLYFHSPMTSR